MDSEIYMHRCLHLAEKGLGNTSPNPLVGAVIVHKDMIIGEGFHQIYGGPHAEVNAIDSVKNKSLLKESQIYVSLEPCSHQGKTPPCAELILKSGIPEVIICNKDPHKKVAGKGIKLLLENGVKVSSGILAEKGEWVNRRFFKSHTIQLPYVILKWAENQNGLIDSIRTDSKEKINWITQTETKTLVHSWRQQEDAILVGANTILNDSPSLTTRHAAGKNPLRVILDPNNKISDNHPFWDEQTDTQVFSKTYRKINSWTNFSKLNSIESIIYQVLKKLSELDVLSVIIEGGSRTLSSFIKENLWDEARILSGKNEWTKGLKAPEITGKLIESYDFSKDKIRIIKRNLNT